MVQNIRFRDVWDGRDCAVGVGGIIVAGAGDDLVGIIGDDMEFRLWVLEAQEAAGYDGYRVVYVVHASEVCDL